MPRLNLAIVLIMMLGLVKAYCTDRYTVIEDFESGVVTLSSWGPEDIDPNAWALDASVTYDGSAYSLRLDGNTWKEQLISPHALGENAVISLAAMHTSGAKAQGIAFSDGAHTLFYSFSGTRTLDIEVWVPVYQGAFSTNVWNLYKLPVGADWNAFFDYSPTLTSIVYINDLDGVSNRSLRFDSILDISDDLPAAPLVTILQSPPTWRNDRDVTVQFEAVVDDPDSEDWTYHWSFGDGESSNLPNPSHNYTVTDAHDYTVSLSVMDNDNCWGYASTSVVLDEGPSSLPLTMNFVGDVMLARRYEQYGGIIPTLGVNAIFSPTLPMLGEGADISVANLEVVLSNVGSPHPTKSVVYRGNPANVSGLTFAGIDVVSLANNHTMDYGLSALQQMQGNLTTAGIIYSGAAEDSYNAYLPAFINRKGINVALLRSSDRTGQYNNAQPYLQAGFNKPGFAYMTPHYVAEQLSAVEGVADLRIVEMHGGSEYSIAPGSGYDKDLNPFLGDTEDEDYSLRSDVPHQWDLDIRHSAIDSGADMVIVHHPHIIQGIELYNGKVIAHSLGNFAFDLTYPECMPSMIFYADAYPDGFRNHRVRPVYIDDYIPKPATGQLGLYILDYLAMKSTELGTALAVDKESLIANVVSNPADFHQVPNQWSTTQNFTTYEDDYQYTVPVKLPRFGSVASINLVEPNMQSEHSLGSELLWYGNFEDEGSSSWDIGVELPEALDGERCARLSSNGGSSTSTLPDKMKLYDNTKRYTLHGWIKTRGATAANISVSFYTMRTSYSPVFTVDVTDDLTGSTDWTFFSRDMLLPPDAWYWDMKLSFSGIGESAAAWFDNVGLIEWTPWQSSADMQQIPFPNNYYWIQSRSQDDAKSITTYLTEIAYSSAIPRSRSRSKPVPIPVRVSPNPFNPSSRISFNLSESAQTKLDIFNLKGQKVRTLLYQDMHKGDHIVTWDGRDQRGNDVASGIYLFRLRSGNRQGVAKAILMK